MDAPTDVSVTEEIAAEGIPQSRPWFTALNKRRWQTFKANRRGFWSLWIFLFLFVISLFAEFIANDKPILVEYEGQYYKNLKTVNVGPSQLVSESIDALLN